jgi:hypothetical protein
METVTGLRTEAARLRGFVDRVTDPAEVAAIEATIKELDDRARAMDNGGASSPLVWQKGFFSWWQDFGM